MDREQRMAFVRSHRTAVFGVNHKKDGPGMSVVYYVMDGNNILTTDPYQQQGLAEYEIFSFEATDFPKRSRAFDTFASEPVRELSSIQETGSSHTYE